MSLSPRRFVCLFVVALFTTAANALPDNIDVKQGGSITFKAQKLPDNTQLSLIPGGTYLSQRTSLLAPAQSLASDGEYALLASGEQGLRVLSLSPNTAPKLRTQLSGNISQLLWHDDYAYLLDQAGWLRIVDVQDRENPLSVSRYPLAQLPDAMAVAQSYLYLTTGKQLTVLDIRQPQSPKKVASYTLPTNATALKVDNGYAYIGSQTGLQILDVRDPNHIQAAGQFRGEVHDLVVTQELAYLANGVTGFTIVDVSDPHKPQWKGSVNRIGLARALRYSDGFVVMTNDRNEMMLIDVHDPLIPQVVDIFYSTQPIKTFDLVGKQVLAATDTDIQVINFSPPVPTVLNRGVNFGGSRRATIHNDILYVADWFSGLHLYDISQPDTPRHLSNYHTQGSSKGVLVRDNYAFVADDDHGLQILDISNPEKPVKVSEVATPGLAYTMKLVGDYIYLADHRGGFHIISIADITHPVIVGSAPTASKTWAVEIVGNLAYVAADSAGLLIFDISDPLHPKQITAYPMQGMAEDIVIRDNFAYVANFDNGFYVLDISQPTQPREIAHLATPGNARGIDLDGNYAYLADWESGIQVIDISRPEQSAIVGAYDTIGWSWGVLTQDNYAYVLDWWGGISILDISTPTQPVLAGTYHARGTTRDVVSKGNYAYVATDNNGLQIFDIQNPLNPTWMGGVALSGEAHSLWLDEQQIYVASGESGVNAIDISNPFVAQLSDTYIPFDTRNEDDTLNINLVRSQGERLYAAETQRGVAVLDTNTGRQTAWYASPQLTDFWVTEDSLLLATPTNVQIIGIDNYKHPFRWLAEGADLLRVQDDLLAIYRRADGILLYDYATLKLLGNFNSGEVISDMQLSDNQLFISGEKSGLLVINISDPRQPTLQAAYPAARNINKFSVNSQAAFLASNKVLNEIKLLPDSTASVKDAQVAINVPKDMPLGSYHLLALNPTDGSRKIYPDVLRIVRPPSTAPKFTMEEFENALRERGLNPNGHQ